MDPTLPAVFSQQFNMPQPSQGGMFGGGDSKWHNAILAALAGFMARRSPGVAGNIIHGLQDSRAMKQRLALAQQQHAQQVQDQLAIHQQTRDYDIAHPMPQSPGEFETALQASGIQPGTPQWAQAMKQRTQNMLDPVVMTPQGPMLRSQLLGTGQPAPPGITFTPVDNGGPTPGASGDFL